MSVFLEFNVNADKDKALADIRAKLDGVSAELPDDAKLKLQAYVTGCYGSLTSFNVLFADDEDQFKGSGGDQDK